MKDNGQKTYSNGAKLSFQVMLPGVTLPISEFGYYVMALLLCSVIHEAGHAIAALQEGNVTLQPWSFSRTQIISRKPAVVG